MEEQGDLEEVSKMALKDWKKTGKNTWRKGSEELSISRASWLTHAKVGYLFMVTNYPRNTFPAKYFKSKSQALRYARAYMRRH